MLKTLSEEQILKFSELQEGKDFENLSEEEFQKLLKENTQIFDTRCLTPGAVFGPITGQTVIGESGCEFDIGCPNCFEGPP